MCSVNALKFYFKYLKNHYRIFTVHKYTTLHVIDFDN